MQSPSIKCKSVATGAARAAQESGAAHEWSTAQVPQVIFFHVSPKPMLPMFSWARYHAEMVSVFPAVSVSHAGLCLPLKQHRIFVETKKMTLFKGIYLHNG